VKPKAPAAPDYVGAAQEQGRQNVQASLATNYLNQANQVGPNGSLTYSYDPTQGHTLADGTFIPQTTATTTLSPEQQRLYDQNTLMSTNLNDLAIQGIGYVGDQANQPIDQNALPSLRSGLATSPFQTTAAPTGLSITGAPSQGQYQTAYDFGSAGAMPNAADFAGQRDQITNAMMERLQPYIERDRAAMDTRLANQGITHGSEAYNWDNNNFQKGVNDQRIAALLAGDQQQQNLFNNAMGIRQQGVGEAQSQGNFFNNATNSQFQQGLAASGFNNQAQGQQFGQNQQQLTNNNQANEAQFNQGLASAQFENQARQQAIQEQDYFRNQPLNMLNALRSGNQVQMPSFGNVSGGSQIEAAPTYQATADSYQGAMQQYQAQMQMYGGILGGLTSLGGAAIIASDRRLKRNIELLSIRPDGLGVYSYNMLWSDEPQIGVMADEVAAFRPEALGPRLGGFATVNYGAL